MAGIGRATEMIRPVDSHGRSALLEFSRSPLLERNAPPTVGNELARTFIRNEIFGFGKFITRDWTWYPHHRNGIVIGADSIEVLDTCVAVNLSDSAPFTQSLVSQSPGWDAALIGFELTSAVTVQRTETGIVVALTFRNPTTGAVKNGGQTVRLEGAPRDVRTLAETFWDTCADALPPERPPLRTASPVLFDIVQKVEDGGTLRELSRGLVQPPRTQAQIDALIAASTMQPSVSPPHPNGFVPLNFPVTQRNVILLEWARHVYHFDQRGESQFGTLDKPFLTPLAATSCARGFVEEWETVSPPLLEAARLEDFPITTLNGSLPTFIQARLAPPNPASALLTC